MSVNEKELQKYKLKMISALGNKIFTPLDFLKADNELLSNSQKQELLSLGQTIAANAKLKRWNQFFKTQTEVIYANTQLPWDNLYNAQNLKQFSKAYGELEDAGMFVNEKGRALETFAINAFYLCKSKTQIEEAIEFLKLGKPDAFGEFLKLNLYHLPEIVSNTSTGKVFLTKILESNSLDNSELNGLFYSSVADLEQNEVFKIFEMVASHIDHFELEDLTETLLDAEFYRVNDDFKVDLCIKGLELLVKYQDKIDLGPDFMDETASYYLSSLILSASSILADTNKSRSAKVSLLDRLWNVFDSIEVNKEDAARAIADTTIADHIAYLPEVLDHVGKRFPHASLCFEQTGDLSDKEWDKFKDLIITKDKEYPGLIDNLDELLKEPFDFSSDSTFSH